MQETVITTSSAADEEGHRHVFRYSLLTWQDPANPEAAARYGVQIEESGGQTARIDGLTDRRARAMLLLSALADFTVTPRNLAEVLEDWGVCG